MTMTVKDAILAVSSHILAAEDGFDQALASTGMLIAATVTTRDQAKLPAHLIQHEMEGLLTAMQHVLTGRKQLLQVHQSYGRTAAAAGFTPQSHGDWWPCPKEPKPGEEMTETAPSHLRVVPLTA